MADGHADLADLAFGEGVVAVISRLGRQIEGDGKAGLALGEIGAIERIRCGRARMAGIGAEDPGFVARHSPGDPFAAPHPRQRPRSLQSRASQNARKWWQIAVVRWQTSRRAVMAGTNMRVIRNGGAIVVQHRIIRRFSLAVLCLAGTALPACGQIITSFAASGTEPTAALGINDAGAVVGRFSNAENSWSHGFLRAADGTVTHFVVAGAVYTFPEQINTRGEIAGFYQDSSVTDHGFLRRPGGAITSFDAPGETETQAQAINDKGVIVGYRRTARAITGWCARRTEPSRCSTSPAPVTPTPLRSTTRTIAGSYSDTSEFDHSFVRAPDGTITTFDPPNATQSASEAINKKGEVAGHFLASTGPHHRQFVGYLREPDGSFRTVEPAGSISTYCTGINASGVIVGSYEDGAGVFHGFVRATDGTITSFDPANADGTYTGGINTAGEIAGSYLDSALDRGREQGFVRTP